LAIQLLILSKYIVIIVLWFPSLLYSLHVGNRVIIRSISMVLGLGILVDTPYLAGSVCSNMGSDNLIVTFRALLLLEGLVGFKYPGQASSVVSLFHRYFPLDQ
jgi:hypothetical protein